MNYYRIFPIVFLLFFASASVSANSSLWKKAKEFAFNQLISIAASEFFRSKSDQINLPIAQERLSKVELRLNEIDQSLALSIRNLRHRIDQGTTYNEYRKLAISSIGDLNEAIILLEGRVDNHERRLINLERRVKRIEKALVDEGFSLTVDTSDPDFSNGHEKAKYYDVLAEIEKDHDISGKTIFAKPSNVSGTLFLSQNEFNIYINKSTYKAFIFYERDIDYRNISHIDYHYQEQWVVAVLKNGKRLDLGVPIQWAIRPGWQRADTVHIVQTKNKKAISGRDIFVPIYKYGEQPF